MQYLVELRIESVQIKEQIYSHVGESGHASIVVLRRIHVVDSYGICPQVCHHVGVQRTLLFIEEGILVSELVRHAWSRVSLYMQLASGTAYL